MNELVIITLDTETGVHNRGEDAIGTMKAAPWHPDNHIVMIGSKEENGGVLVTKFVPSCYEELTNELLYVGQNIKFDMHYLMKDSDGFRKNIWPKTHLWDTMIAEYILTGQTSQYASLDKLSAKYGGSLKDDRIKEYWENGVDTEDIPEGMLVEYLEHDVKNTELVFQAQYERAKELGMLPLILSQMRALKATTEMEWNGMFFDKEIAQEKTIELELEMEEHQHVIGMEAMHIFDAHFFTHDFNMDSSAHIALMLFGGEYKYKKKQPMMKDGEVVVYKSGAKKGLERMENVEVVSNTVGYGIPLKEEYKTSKGKPSTKDDVLQDILATPTKLPVGCMQFIQSLLAYRKLQKDVSTYFEGYSKLVWPDGIIHHQLNQVGTDTGRLSSSKPNLQNVTTKED